MAKISKEKMTNLDKAQDYLVRVYAVIDKIKKGESESSACEKMDIDKMKFRRFINNLKDENMNFKSMTGDDVFTTPAERLYMDLFFTTDLKDIPDDIDNVWTFIFNDILSKRERAVLRSRYWECLTLEECSNEFDVTKERIRQIEAKAFRKLRGKGFRKYPNIYKYGLKGRKIFEDKKLLDEKAKWDRKLISYYNSLKDVESRKSLYDTLKIIDEKLVEKLDEGQEITLSYIFENEYIPTRLYNVLMRYYNGDLNIPINDIYATDMLKMRNLGNKSMEEFIDILKKYDWNNDNREINNSNNGGD